MAATKGKNGDAPKQKTVGAKALTAPALTSPFSSLLSLPWHCGQVFVFRMSIRRDSTWVVLQPIVSKLVNDTRGDALSREYIVGTRDFLKFGTLMHIISLH